MKVKCQECSNIYDIDENKLPDQPVVMKCKNCNNNIILKKPESGGNGGEKTSRDKINKILENVDSLPTLPTIANQIIQCTNDKNSSSTQISKLVSQDQSLTMKVLKIVNSPFYGFPRKITTINHAVVILGAYEIQTLVVGASIVKAFSRSKNNSIFNREKFWVHSIGCGVASKMLARVFQYRISGEAFVAGLIHDIGKIILDQYLNTDFEKVLKEARDKKVSLFKAEKDILGTTHTELGKTLGEKWELPSHLIEVIHNHHDPFNSSKDRDIVSLVYFANILCRMGQVGMAGGDGYVPKIDDKVWGLLKSKKPDLNDSYIDKFIYDLKSEMEQTQGLLSVLQEKKEKNE